LNAAADAAHYPTTHHRPSDTRGRPGDRHDPDGSLQRRRKRRRAALGDRRPWRSDRRRR